MALPRFWFVAAMTRTSTFRGFLPPIGSTKPSSSTRSSLAWAAKDNSPSSSRKRVPPGKKADYHGAIDLWLKRHGSRTVFCFVQFGGVPLDALPRMYLATPAQVAKRLRETSRGRGDSILDMDVPLEGSRHHRKIAAGLGVFARTDRAAA